MPLMSAKNLAHTQVEQVPPIFEQREWLDQRYIRVLSSTRQRSPQTTVALLRNYLSGAEYGHLASSLFVYRTQWTVL